MSEKRINVDCTIYDLLGAYCEARTRRVAMTREQVIERITQAFGFERNDQSTSADEAAVMADLAEVLTWIKP